MKVTDKKSFREWCNYMMLNAKQVSVILEISPAMVYKNIQGDGELRGLLCLTCDLISQKPINERSTWIKERIHQKLPSETWPAEKPISAES